ncbi:HlyD family efflux transporter periplasmic adaptor subunit [Janthinobacterium aquaticum]|uniref:HlyD family efflux transporter periplasmic adaptor subunit n=1 Tax=Janthinobacterium sp. FT58W TaxID=2654254 RepID=UPI0012659A5D|nr:HlyD family efflux transporter periplasmic adaptor subunit [Janthinobacterium sp. FT58W]KAB8044652.1 HlyD family efflux transporter periplasmic adaptor subunit [Janthinobacterium sp. FT58W]
MSESPINLQSIGTLLQIEQDVRQAASESAVEFIAVNDTWRLLPYRQAVLWRNDMAGVASVKLVSGLADLPVDSPYRQWMNQALRLFAPDLAPGQTKRIIRTDMPEAMWAGWDEWMGACALLVPLPTPAGTTVGGLWLTLEQDAGEAETALLARLAGAYGQALWAWRVQAAAWRTTLARLRKRPKWLWLAALGVALIPMRLTVLAPAEIIGKDAKLIAAPQDGVVARFFVAPNQTVAAGAPLFALEDMGARNRNEVAAKSEAVAAAEYLRATQKSFSDGASKADLSALNARLEEKAAEAQYVKDMLERIQVRAPEAGIAVFSDPNDWLGKPVQTGERIILLANPAKVQIAIRLPVDDALSLDPGAAVKLYLNVAPLSTVAGVLTQSSYEPALTSDGVVAYSLKADLAAGEAVQRIGLKGTAKLYGGWAPLIYHVLRKPLAVVRRTLGV